MPAGPGALAERAYLVPTIGYARTPEAPDLALATDIRVTALVRKNDWDLPATARSNYLASIRTSAGQNRWVWFVYSSPTAHALYHDLYPGGVRNPPNASVANTTQLAAVMPAGKDVFLGSEFRLNISGGSQTRALSSTDGVSWSQFGAPRTGPAAPGGAAAAPLTIGGAYSVSPFIGRIYWMQMEKLGAQGNPTGEIIWRFDASEYPGTGTSFTDPRGRTWTLTDPSAIVPARYLEWDPLVLGDVVGPHRAERTPAGPSLNPDPVLTGPSLRRVLTGPGA